MPVFESYLSSSQAKIRLISNKTLVVCESKASACVCVTRFIKTLRAGLIVSNGFLNWGWLLKGAMGLVFGSFSKDHSTKRLH